MLANELEYNPRMPWSAVCTHMAHHADHFWDKRGEETCSSVNHQRFVPVTPCPCPTKISLPHQGSELCYWMELGLVHISSAGKGRENPLWLIRERWAASMSHLKMAQKVLGYVCKPVPARVVRMLVSGA